MSNFTQFDSGEPVEPLDKRQIPTRRAGDIERQTNLEVIAHKTSRIAGELTEFKSEMRDAIKRIEASITYTHSTLHEATERAKEAAEKAESSVKHAVQEAMTNAFPDGDPDGHRRHHELVIKKAEESAEFWASMRKELGKVGLIGFLAWAGYWLWLAAIKGPMK